MRSVHAYIFCIAPILKVSQSVPTRSQNVSTHCLKCLIFQALYLRSELKVYEDLCHQKLQNYAELCVITAIMQNYTEIVKLCKKCNRYKIIRKVAGYGKLCNSTITGPKRCP